MHRIILLSITIVCTHLSMFSQNVDCIRQTDFGTVEICLPAIKGYAECYLDPAVKPLADATEVPLNMVLGYYINDNTYEQLDSVEVIDDFFKVYGTKQLKDIPASKNEINEIGTMMKGSFIIKNWDEMVENMDLEKLDLEIGTPTVIKSYSLDDSSFTLIMIIRYAVEGVEPYEMVVSISGFLSNDRMVWLAYYLLFEGEETIKEVESKSNEILSQLQKAG